MTTEEIDNESLALDQYTSSILVSWEEGKSTIPLEKHFCHLRNYSSSKLEELMVDNKFMESFRKMKDVQENLLTAGALMGRFKGDFALAALKELSLWAKDQPAAVQANIQINSFDLPRVESVMKKLMAMNEELQLNKEVGEILYLRGGANREGVDLGV